MSLSVKNFGIEALQINNADYVKYLDVSQHVLRNVLPIEKEFETQAPTQTVQSSGATWLTIRRSLLLLCCFKRYQTACDMSSKTGSDKFMENVV